MGQKFGRKIKIFGCGLAAQDAPATMTQCMPMQILRQRVVRLQTRISQRALSGPLSQVLRSL